MTVTTARSAASLSRPPRRPGLRSLGVGLVAAAMVLAGCSGEDSGTGADSDASGSADTAAGDSAFPVTIDTAYGEVTVTEEPERIVALGFNYADMLSSLDITPVATTAGAEIADVQQLEAAYPWLDADSVGELDPGLAGADRSASLEAIAAFEPDLILANTWSVSPELYEQASQIAPTFVGVEEGTQDWDVTLEAIGELTGKPDAAAEVIADVEAEYATAREELPELEGKTVNYFAYSEETGLYSGNSTWLHGFGLVPADNQDDTQRDRDAYISLENLDRVTADVLVIWNREGSGARETLEADPRFAELAASRNNAVIFIDTPLAMATNSAGPNSLKWMIEEISPEFAEADFSQSGE